jgi:hypothetical protein
LAISRQQASGSAAIEFSNDLPPEQDWLNLETSTQFDEPEAPQPGTRTDSQVTEADGTPIELSDAHDPQPDARTGP